MARIGRSITPMPGGPTDAGDMELSAIRLMTWNIHGARPVFGRPDLPRVIAFVRSHAPDIVALQEVDARRCGSAFDLLSQALGAHRAEARMMVAPEGDRGHVLLTRWPIIHWRLHDISVERRESRAALEATIETPTGRLHVVAVHLGLSLRERHRQARKLAALATSTATPTVMLGDFNDWFWHGSVQWSLRELFPERSRFRTFPAVLPLFRLDRIYCRPEGILERVFTDPAARAISDHLPVLADIDPAALSESKHSGKRGAHAARPSTGGPSRSSARGSR